MNPKWADAYLNNSMTYQLGNHIYPDFRDPDSAKVLDQAKARIKEMDFVAFFEFLDEDFWELKNKIFSHVQIPFSYPFWFQVGATVNGYRMRVLKYSATLPPDEMELVQQLTHLDMKLYYFSLETLHPTRIKRLSTSYWP